MGGIEDGWRERGWWEGGRMVGGKEDGGREGVRMGREATKAGSLSDLLKSRS